MQLTIDDVGKQYRRDVWGLRDFTLELGPGVLGLLGPNGAGNSTLMRILATVTHATEGRVTWNGTDITQKPDELRQVQRALPEPALRSRGRAHCHPVEEHCFGPGGDGDRDRHHQQGPPGSTGHARKAVGPT